MTSTERPMPPPNADERTTLATWLDFYRTTLVMKCDGLADEQLRLASAPPSTLTLLGLVQHLAEVERNWFRRVLTGEDVPPIYGSGERPEGHDGGFDVGEHSTYSAAAENWQKEVEIARSNCDARALDSTSPFGGDGVTLRWIYTHMIAEYARHCGQADLLRERIDGVTGV
ncbi:DinB family protein [Actinomycetes bacterium M1A6_2h]